MLVEIYTAYRCGSYFTRRLRSVNSEQSESDALARYYSTPAQLDELIVTLQRQNEQHLATYLKSNRRRIRRQMATTAKLTGEKATQLRQQSALPSDALRHYLEVVDCKFFKGFIAHVTCVTMPLYVVRTSRDKR